MPASAGELSTKHRDSRTEKRPLRCKLANLRLHHPSLRTFRKFLLVSVSSFGIEIIFEFFSFTWSRPLSNAAHSPLSLAHIGSDFCFLILQNLLNPCMRPIILFYFSVWYHAAHAGSFPLGCETFPLGFMRFAGRLAIGFAERFAMESPCMEFTACNSAHRLIRRNECEYHSAECGSNWHTHSACSF